MGKARRPIPGAASSIKKTQGLLELDRFTNESLERWSERSKDLDFLHNTLFFVPEAERRSRRGELLAALRSGGALEVTLNRWVRVVSFQFSNAPLSCAGSMRSYGGRLDSNTAFDLAGWDTLPRGYANPK